MEKVQRRHPTDMCLVQKIMHKECRLDLATWFERVEQSAHKDPLNIKVRTGRAGSLEKLL